MEPLSSVVSEGSFILLSFCVSVCVYFIGGHKNILQAVLIDDRNVLVNPNVIINYTFYKL